jgi:hypothetical protein
MHQFSQIYSGNETLHISDSSSVRHQELFTVHTAMVYVIQVCRQLSSSSRIKMELQFHLDPAAYSLFSLVIVLFVPLLLFVLFIKGVETRFFSFRG